MMEMTRCLAVIGFSGVGKTTVSKLVAKKLGVSRCEIGPYVVADWKKCEGCSNTLVHATHVISTGDSCRFIKRAVADSHGDGGDTIFVGLRLPDELTHLKSLYQDVFAVTLFADFSIRATRLSMRQDPHSCDLIDLSHRDRVELSWGMGDLMANSSYQLLATGQAGCVADELASLWNAHRGVLLKRSR